MGVFDKLVNTDNSLNNWICIIDYKYNWFAINTSCSTNVLDKQGQGRGIKQDLYHKY